MTAFSSPAAFRPVTPEDVSALKRLIDATGLFPSTLLDRMLAPYFEQDPGGHEMWLTNERGGPAAVAYCAPERMTDGTWNLLLIAVHPDCQGRGTGAALIRSVEERVVAKAGHVLLIETSALTGYARQRSFYRNLGYREEARIRDFYQSGEDKVVYWKSLQLVVRPAVAADVDILQTVELDSAQAYGAYAETAFCLDLPTRSAAEHGLARERGLALAGEVGGGRIAGFVLAMPKDGRAHLLEVAVAREHQGRGYGRQLIAAFEAWARDAGYSETTLTTFRDVKWNAPFYASLGYDVIELDGGRRELIELVADEKASGFHQAPRVVMSKRLSRHRVGSRHP